MNARPKMRMWISLVAGCVLGSASLGAEQATEEPQMVATVQDGVTVQIDYTLTVDGKVVDSSEGRGPLSYVQGQKQIVPGLERQLTGLHVGDARELTVTPEEGYGQVDPKAFVQVPKEQLPADVTPTVGLALRGMNPDGRSFRATIHEIGPDSVTLDLNHPLAGKTLKFNVKVVKIAPGQ